MRILVISQYFPPEGSAAYYPYSLAEELSKRGHEVKVITGFPNYPTGKLAPGYKMEWRSREKFRGVEVLRVPLYLDHSNSAIRRMVNYVSFGISAATAWKWPGKVDVVYVYATQMTPALGPWLWKFFSGAPYVLHVQDLWPDSITGSSMVKDSRLGKLIESLMNPWLRSVYKHSSAVIGIAPTMVEILKARGVSADKAHVVYNWGTSIEKAAHNGQSFGSLEGDTEFLYAGNIGDMQDLTSLVKAASKIQDSAALIKIVGDGVDAEKIRTLAGELGLKNIEFEGAVPLEEVDIYYETARFALVTLKDLPNLRGTIPSKFQAAMARGIPVVSTVQGDLRNLIESEGIGFTADSENPDDLANALRSACNLSTVEYLEMVKKTQKLHDEVFSISAGVSSIEEILERVSR